MSQKYFKLFNYVRFLGNENSGCIYNTLNGDMIAINSDFSNFIGKSFKNIPINDEDKDLVNDLIKENIGCLYDKPVFIEEPRAGAGNQFKDYLRKRVYLKNLYFQMSNECNLNCVYCNEDTYVIRPTSCKKWSNKSIEIDNLTLIEMFKSAKKLGCENVHLIGGEPFLDKNRLFNILKLLNYIEFNNIYIYTNLTVLDNEIIEEIRDKKITLVIEMPSLDQIIYSSITKSNYQVSDILSMLQVLNKLKIYVVAHYSISKYNENEISRDVSELKRLFDDVIIDFIYPIKNDHYSMLYEKQMYQRRFPKVTTELITILEDYNSDLYGKLNLSLSGVFTPCPMICQIEVGNIFSSRVEDVLKSKKYMELIRMSRSKLPKCSKCNFRLNCPDIRSIEYSASGKIDGVEFCNE